jgi:hypothetical protein
MKELDVTKPMKLRESMRPNKIEFLTYLNCHASDELVLKMTNQDGYEHIIRRFRDGRISRNSICDMDIINVPEPEQPALNWDKPIRHKLGNIAVGVFDNSCDIYPKLVVFKGSFGHHTDIFTNEGKCCRDDDEPALENYEKEGSDE